MSLRLLIDENSQADALVNLLRAAGHNISTVAEERLGGADDSTVLSHAHANQRCVLTRDAGDFEDLHSSGAQHSGILAIYEGSVRAKNMTHRDIVNAINRLEAAGIDIKGQFIPLNAWDY